MSAAASMLSAFRYIERPLDYQPRAGGAWVELGGVLRDPTPEELAGGLDRESRLVTVRHAALVAAAGAEAPGKGDRVRDPESGRVYVVAGEWDRTFAGAVAVFARATVRG